MANNLEELVFEEANISLSYAPFIPVAFSKAAEERLCKEHFGGMSLDEVEKILRELYPENFI